MPEARASESIGGSGVLHVDGAIVGAGSAVSASITSSSSEAAANPCGLSRLLQRSANASVPGHGFALPSVGPAPRPARCSANPRRAAPSILPDIVFSRDREPRSVGAKSSRGPSVLNGMRSLSRRGHPHCGDQAFPAKVAARPRASQQLPRKCCDAAWTTSGFITMQQPAP